MPAGELLLDQPHHDGSSLLLPDQQVQAGDVVTALVRVPHRSGVTQVHVRAVRDGEPTWDAGVIDHRSEHETWWRVRITAANPVTPYRFLLTGPSGYRWLTGTGVHTHDVADSGDFRLSTFPRPPAWSRRAVVYQIFPDRFARSAEAEHRQPPDWAVPAGWDEPVKGRGPDTPRQLYGGDLRGILEHLDHVAALGADTVYLTPVFPARSNHRYDASSFHRIDPLLGGEQALAELSRGLHERGMRLIGDLTLNHSGDSHEWFRTAQDNPESAERGFYYFGPGGAADYAMWLEVPSLPKFDLGSAELRRRLVEGPDSVTAHWMRPPWSLDGWRVDVANMAGRHRADDYTLEVARLMRRTMEMLNPESLLIAEHAHDAAGDLPGDGWHATMAYAWFTRPVWAWLRHPQLRMDFLGMPTEIPRGPASTLVATIRALAGPLSWPAYTTSLNLLSSHDTARIRTVTADPAVVRLAAGLLFTLPGIPMVFAGDEIGMAGELGEDSRRPMPWAHPQSWDTQTLAAYRALARLRRDSPALAEGGLRWVHAGVDSLTFLRESPEQRLLVHAVRAGGPPVRLPASALGMGPTRPEAENVHGGARLRVNPSDGTLTLPSDGPDLQVFALPAG